MSSDSRPDIFTGSSIVPPRSKRADAEALFAQAEGVGKLAQVNADTIIAKAQADRDALIAEAQKIRDEVVEQKAVVDRELAAAVADRKQLAAEREAAARLGEEAEKARATFEYKTACIRIIIDEFSKEGSSEDMGARVNARQAALKPLVS